MSIMYVETITLDETSGETAVISAETEAELDAIANEVLGTVEAEEGF